MESPAREIARRLAENAEAVCRRYLSNGRREGQYWIVGDVGNSKGRSLYVRLAAGSDGARPGKWTDAATGDHGDLLDVIAASGAHARFRDTLAEARHFLSLPPPADGPRNPRARKAAGGSPGSARRLVAASRPIGGSVVEEYLASRLLGGPFGPPLGYHPRCFYRPSEEDADALPLAWPAMIAAVTDDEGTIHGAHRTWIEPATRTKAPVACPRRAMGHLLGHGVRFGASGPVMAFGEGIETMLSLREAAPTLPLIAGLSSAHLAAIRFPAALRRLYIVCDNDPAGEAAFATLAERAGQAGIEIFPLTPRLDDLNSDLCRFGRTALVDNLNAQLCDDATRFLARR